MKTKLSKQTFSIKFSPQTLAAFVFVLLFAAIGLHMLLSSHAATTYNIADLDKNGIVDIRDLSIMAANWGATSAGDTTPPTSSITAPLNGATVSGTVTINATATDDVGIAKVEFYNGSTLLSTVTSATNGSYIYSWNTTTVANGGNYNLTAKAYDAANNWAISNPAVVTVNNVGSQPPPPPPSSGGWWKPTSAHSISWNWIIGATPSSTPVPPAVYDIDGFDNSAATVSAIHAKGGIAICYIDVGTWETGRPDLNLIPAADKGPELPDWPGEFWLKISDISGLTPMVTSRMQMCKTKGFDAIEPDDIDGYTNTSTITASQQIAYNTFLANTAHGLGMSIGLKNDIDQAPQLQPLFDWALNEQCNEYSECNTMAPFTNANKAVFNAEYSGGTSFCSADAAAHINGAGFNLSLNGSNYQPCTQTW